MRITYDTLNEYVIVPVKNILKVITTLHNEDSINAMGALCVPFYGSFSFLNEDLKPFRDWHVDNQGLAFLVKDIELYTFDVPLSEWNRYVIYGTDIFKDDVIINEFGIGIYSYDNSPFFTKIPILIDDIKKNDIINQPTGVSIYDLMYGINKFAKAYYSNKLHHGLEKAGVSAKEASKIIQDKVKDTEGKAKLHLVPQQILYDIAEVREYGNKKYPTGGEDNWKLGDPKDYLDAAYRHLTKMVRDGIDSKDEESGIEHYKHLATNVSFICGFMGGEHEDISRAVEE